MGTFNLVVDIRSMTPAVDVIYQAAAAANRSSMYTVVNFSGKGLLSAISATSDAGWADSYFQLTVDGGGVVTIDSNNITLGGNLFFSIAGVSSYGRSLIFATEFDTSLLFKIGNDNPSTKNIAGGGIYQSFSEEYDRTLHPAGSQIPDAFGGFRPDTMPIDIMLIWYKSKDGSIGNRMIVTQNKAPLINDKALTGIIRKSQFDIALKGPKFSWIKDNRNVQMNVSISGRNYQVDFANGILNPSSLVLLDRAISNEDFMDRFTLTELEDIELKSETTPKLRAVMNKIGYMEKVDLDTQKLNQLLIYLVSQNVLTGQRKNEILA